MFVTERAETARALDQLDEMLAELNQQRHEVPLQHNNENDNNDNNDNNDFGHGSSQPESGIACCFFLLKLTKCVYFFIIFYGCGCKFLKIFYGCLSQNLQKRPEH